MDKRLDIVVESVNETDGPDIEQAPLAADVDSLDAVEGLDASETEQGCFNEEELNGPDDFLVLYEETIANEK